MSQLSQAIDHTLLKPFCTDTDIVNICQEANKYEFAAVCVPPTFVSLAEKNTDESVAVCTVIGFPFGYDETVTKIAAIRKAVESGADELDVVINISKVKSADWESIKNEVDQLVTIIKSKYNKVLKLILETAYLTNEELTTLCHICNDYGVDYAKTSTGYGPEGADLSKVKLMRKLLNKKVKIKASGGISTKAEAEAFIAAGASRIGASKGVLILS